MPGEPGTHAPDQPAERRLFRRHLPSSWGQHYLADRFGEDITNDPRFQPGQAPTGWTNLVDHLRQYGVSDDEMIITGVATMASTG